MRCGFTTPSCARLSSLMPNRLNVHDEDKAAFERLCLGVQIEQEGVGVSGVPVN
jgi:hypothetical protein